MGLRFVSEIKDFMDDSIKSLSVKGVKWSATGGFLTTGTSFVVGLVIARILTPEDYGIVGMLSVFVAISQVFVNSGFSAALVRMTDRTMDDYATAFYFNVVVGLFAYGCLFLTAPNIAAFYKMPILIDILRVFALVLIIQALQIVPQTKLIVAVDFKTQALVTLFASLLSGTIGILMAYRGYGVWALVWQSIINTVICVIMFWKMTGWKPWEGRFTRASFNRLFSFGSKLLASALLHKTYMNVSALLIGKFYTSADLGYYKRGQQIAEKPSMYLSDIFQRVSYPILSKLQDDDETLSRTYRRYQGMSSIVVFFLMVLLAAVAKPLVLLLLTEKWIGAVPFLRIFCLALIFDHLCSFNNNMMYVKGRSDIFLRLEIIKKVIVFPLLLLAIPYGVIAICFVPVVHEMVDLAIGTYYVRRLFGAYKTNPLKDYGVYLFCSIVANLPAFFCCSLDISPWFSLPIAVICSTSIYLGLLWRDKNMKDMVKIVKGSDIHTI